MRNADSNRDKKGGVGQRAGSIVGKRRCRLKLPGILKSGIAIELICNGPRYTIGYSNTSKVSLYGYSFVHGTSVKGGGTTVGHGDLTAPMLPAKGRYHIPVAQPNLQAARWFRPKTGNLGTGIA